MKTSLPHTVYALGVVAFGLFYVPIKSALGGQWLFALASIAYLFALRVFGASVTWRLTHGAHSKDAKHEVKVVRITHWGKQTRYTFSYNLTWHSWGKTMQRACAIAFFSGLSVFLTYQCTWWAFRLFGWHWSNDYNIPGFILLVAASPWSSIVYASAMELNSIFGETGRNLISALLVAIGLGMNCAVAACVLIKISSLVRRYRR